MSTRPRLKICGVTNVEDAKLVGASGADYCGILVNVSFSERSLSLRQAQEVASAAGIPVVILLCDPDLEAAEEVARNIKPHALQLLCKEPPELVRKLKSCLPCQIWKTVHLSVLPGQASAEEYVRAGADVLLIDSIDSSKGFLRFGGTGKLVDWRAAAALVKKVSIPVFLAGGIDPDNVERAIIEVRPHGIDLCSGVESSKGKKDPEKVHALLDNFEAAVTKV